MLTLIHGEDIAGSRKYLLELKQKTQNTVSLEGDKVNITDLTQILDGGGFFTETIDVFIEQFISKKKKSAEFTQILDYLLINSQDKNIYLWEPKELEKGSLNLFKNVTVKTFKLPQTLFSFLDGIKPGNGNVLIKLFHQTLETSETEMIFFMLIRQFRLFLALNSSLRDHEVTKQSPPQEIAILPAVARNDMGDIDELKRMAPWQRSKLQRQAALFDKKELIKQYNKLFQLEIGQKTGSNVVPMISAIDFFLLEV